MRHATLSIFFAGFLCCITAHALDIAFVSERTLLKNSEPYQALLKKTLQKAYDKKVSMDKVFDARVQTYQDFVKNKAVLNRVYFKEESARLYDHLKKQEEKIHTLQKQAMYERQELRNDERNRIQKIIQTYAKKHHIDLILNKGSIFLNNNDNIVDITPKITQLLNEKPSA